MTREQLNLANEVWSTLDYNQQDHIYKIYRENYTEGMVAGLTTQDICRNSAHLKPSEVQAVLDLMEQTNHVVRFQLWGGRGSFVYRTFPGSANPAEHVGYIAA